MQITFDGGLTWHNANELMSYTVTPGQTVHPTGLYYYDVPANTASQTTWVGDPSWATAGVKVLQAHKDADGVWAVPS